MKPTTDSLIQLFKTVRNKEKLLHYVSQNPDAFNVLLALSLEENTPEAWRAAWLVGHTMRKNDHRIIPSIDILIKILKEAKEGHQRQLIILLLKMELNEEQEGKLFDSCLSIWEQINCIPSTRITALKFILKTVKKFPELKNEIKLWTQDMYLETLSPGIKNSVLKQVKDVL
jgi:hypothetical protein